MDLLDVFIGSEGTLGVIVEAELKLLPRPEGLLSGVVFFSSDESLLRFVQEARRLSLEHRNRNGEAAGQLGALVEKAFQVTTRRPINSLATEVQESKSIDARALEYFDPNRLTSCARNMTRYLAKRWVRSSSSRKLIQLAKTGDAQLAIAVGNS